MLLQLNFGFEGFWVSVHEGQHCVISLLLIGLQVMATDAIASLPANLVIPKTITI